MAIFSLSEDILDSFPHFEQSFPHFEQMGIFSAKRAFL